MKVQASARGIVALLILTAVLVTVTIDQSVTILQRKAESQGYDAEAAMEYICSVLTGEGVKEKCSKIPTPKVVFKDMDWMLYGYFLHGGDVVYIASYLVSHPGRAMETIAHESTHYVLDQLYPEGVEMCFSEEIARRVQALWSDENYTDKWREYYEGCELPTKEDEDGSDNVNPESSGETGN